MDLFVTGEVPLHSGGTSDFKIEADALSEAELATLARLLAARLPPFASVEGIPRGGLRLAQHLRHHVTAGGLHLIADDVYTSGSSLEDARGTRHQDAGVRPILGAVLFARKPVTQSWIYALFVLQPPFEGNREPPQRS